MQLLNKDRALQEFELGPLFVDPVARKVLRNRDLLSGLLRHMNGDWGEIDQKTQAANEAALSEGDVIRSVFYTLEKVKFCVETDLGERFTKITVLG